MQDVALFLQNTLETSWLQNVNILAGIQFPLMYYISHKIWKKRFLGSIQVIQHVEGQASAYVCKKWDTCTPEAILNAVDGINTFVEAEGISIMHLFFFFFFNLLSEMFFSSHPDFFSCTGNVQEMYKMFQHDSAQRKWKASSTLHLIFIYFKLCSNQPPDTRNKSLRGR